MNCVIDGLQINGISSCVPKAVVKNDRNQLDLPQEEIDKLVNSIGIKEKRVADLDVTAADLCYKAGDKLLNELNINRDEVDAVIFMTQTPDYLMPANAPILQHRLGLKKDAICFDMGLACSGYVYALFVASSILQNPAINNVLLLDGETASKFTSKKDYVNYPLYGDAGTATLIGKGSIQNTSYFSLYTDGSGYDAVMIESGGYRNPISIQGLEELPRDSGNYGRSNDVYMDGLKVFNFTMKEVPKSVKKTLEFAETTIDAIDYFVFHQSNKFMTDFFAKKLKIPLDKMLYSIQKFGNTSSASIPLTISVNHQVFEHKENSTILLSGFGAGLSWGNALVILDKTLIIPPIEM
ncbi:MAG: ketoacyl-ACP synthase III [Fermentimonas sp.]|nr:ketoacyl-ACP synthase III [Fermentimonas sp.]